MKTISKSSCIVSPNLNPNLSPSPNPNPGTLMRFDFEKPHYPFSLAHELANVRRFDEVRLTRTPGDIGHIVVDSFPHTVYVADTGGNRIIAVDADSGRFDQHARADLGGAFESIPRWG